MPIDTEIDAGICNLSSEEIVDLLLHGDPNRWRHAWRGTPRSLAADRIMQLKEEIQQLKERWVVVHGTQTHIVNSFEGARGYVDAHHEENVLIVRMDGTDG